MELSQKILQPALIAIFAFLFARVGVTQEKTQTLNEVREQPYWVDFYQEKVTIVCYDRDVEIEGVYFLRNLTAGTISMIIQYPFPVDKNHPFPHEIKVEDYPFRKDSANIYVNMSLKPHEEKSIRFFYKQLHRNRSATYILSSTQHWEYPIQKAEFVISVPHDWNTNISIESDKNEIKEGRLIYYISKTDFLPKEDLVITWQ